MSEPWLSIIGFGEDGLSGLSPASLNALNAAEVVMGPSRHLAMVPESDAKRIEWPVPFADGLPILDGLRGCKVAVLTSGDPFWFGAGSVLAQHFNPDDWEAFPGSSVFSLAASHLGWPIERTVCLGLHAAPMTRLKPHLAPGQRMIATLRDGGVVSELASYLTDQGFGETRLTVMEALGGPRERLTTTTADAFDLSDIAHPVTVAMLVEGTGAVLSRTSGQVDEVFETDGQITKRPVRALTLSALSPKPGEHLWDIGAGSGSIAIEWLLADPTLSATAIELREDRAARINGNALALGQDRLAVIQGRVPEVLEGLAAPDAVFVGGGLNRETLDWLWPHLEPGTRLVANAVTLDTQAILIEAQATHGGTLMKIDLAEAAPLGNFRGWKASYTLVQWSVVR